MPVQTAIQTRRGTASSWTSTNPTLAAGEIGFETDTGKFKIGTGSTAWASLPYAAIDAGLLAAKGDLVTATANDTPAVLTVGSNGETLVADSSASTGLRWQGNFAAGKNKIINGDFGIWQRGTSFTGQANGDFSSDRWRIGFNGSGATTTTSRQTFTPGTAPVAGYEGQYFLRHDVTVAGTGSTARVLRQYIEDARTFAGQTVTLSFWAKADSTRTVTSGLAQVFGTGGSTAVGTTTQANTVTTSWQRFTQVISVPSVAGQTIGTDSYLRVDLSMPVNTTMTIDFWGVQLEAGNVATAFQTATGTLAGELSAAQRYYWRSSGSTIYGAHGVGAGETSTTAYIVVNNPVPMRTNPSSIEFSTLALYDQVTVTGLTNLLLSQSNNRTTTLQAVVASGLTVYRPYTLLNNNNTAGYLAINAEL